MLHRILLSMLCVLFIDQSRLLCWGAATEGLDEMMARKQRQVTATWGRQYLENPKDKYIWQPETLMYTDQKTGHEIWVLARQPDHQDVYSKEHGSNAWSFDGSRIGLFDYSTRDTNNPAISAGNDRGSRMWIVNADGSGLRAVESYGKYTIPFEGFSWSHTENSYYTFGTHALIDGPLFNLYKVKINQDNTTTGQLILDTSSINSYSKSIVKDGVSADDSWITFMDGTIHAAGGCSKINSTELYFTHLDGSPDVDYHWGIARGIGPVGDPYGTHIPQAEDHFHDIWAIGPNAGRIIGDYSGTSDLFVSMTKNGSCADGGPQWADWNGTSFGPNNEIEVISNGTGSPTNPYGLPYLGHPTFDRWGKYGLIGTYTDNPKPGTRILDLTKNSLLPHYVFSYGLYDGEHHSWAGFTDTVLAVNPANWIIYANKYTLDYTHAFEVADTHYIKATTNYNAHPRPSESPDGTKVAFAATWLNNGGDANPFVQWAVVEYPHPPKITGVTKPADNISLAWTPPQYTTRGWPDENKDAPPDPREIKYFHLWWSTDGNSWNEFPLGAGIPFSARTTEINQQAGTTLYYAMTSEEHSRLESRTLSNIWRITLDANGLLVDSSETGTYPPLPGGIKPFWTTPPPSPNFFSAKGTGVIGHYRLEWTEPEDLKIRYYNIYYSSQGTPEPEQRFKIASVPKGTKAWLDWNADPNMPANYRITSVDRQGNEGTLTAPSIKAIRF